MLDSIIQKPVTQKGYSENTLAHYHDEGHSEDIACFYQDGIFAFLAEQTASGLQANKGEHNEQNSE